MTSRYLKLIFLFLDQNIRCGYSKKTSQWDGCFKHPKQMFKLMDKKIITILRLKFLLIWTYSTDQSKCSNYYNYGKKKLWKDQMWLSTSIKRTFVLKRALWSVWCLSENLSAGLLTAMKKVNKQCLLDTPRTVRVSEKNWQVIVRTRRP